MQDYNLNVTALLDYAARWHPEQEIVCRTVEGPTLISSYADVHKRAQMCAMGLAKLGVR